LKEYLIRKRGSCSYAARGGGMRQDIAEVMAFASLEEAEFYRLQFGDARDQYEICELTADGRLIPVKDRE
jgi:hypothetical protein